MFDDAGQLCWLNEGMASTEAPQEFADHIADTIRFVEASPTSYHAAAELARLGRDEHLSAQRSNGVRAMVARIRESAAAA